MCCIGLADVITIQSPWKLQAQYFSPRQEEAQDKKNMTPPRFCKPDYTASTFRKAVKKLNKFNTILEKELYKNLED